MIFRNENTFDVYEYRRELYSKGVSSEFGQTKKITEANGDWTRQLVRALPSYLITEKLANMGTIQGHSAVHSGLQKQPMVMKV